MSELVAPAPAAPALSLPALPVAPPLPSVTQRQRPKGHIRQGVDVTAAFGFILDEKALMPWAEYFYELTYQAKMSSLPPEEVLDAYQDVVFTAVNTLPHTVYHRVRGLPRLYRAILLINPNPGKLKWLFVLRDNSSRPALDLEIDPEDIKRVAEVLKVEDQEPKWYRIVLYS